MPLSLEEYRLGMLFSVSKASALETTGGQGVELLVTRPFDDPQHGGAGVYTEKLLRIGRRLPLVLQKIIPSKQLDKLVLVERCWNCFPKVKTAYECPFAKDFSMTIDTVCVDDDAGCAEEGHGLSPQEKANCRVEVLDIFSIDKDQYRAEEDPTKVTFTKAASRGPLVKGWAGSCQKIMCVYKTVKVHYPVRCSRTNENQLSCFVLTTPLLQVRGLQDTVEKIALKKGIQDVVHRFHRQMFCWMDEWIDLDDAAIQAFERDSAEAANSHFEEKGHELLSSGGSITVDVKAVSTSELKGAEAECGSA